MAIMRAVTGGAGSRETTSAARVFASVTASAPALGAAATTSAASSANQTEARQRMVVMGRSSLSEQYPGAVQVALAEAKKSVRLAVEVSVPELILTLLGGFRAQHAGRTLTFSKKAQGLVAHLALTPGHTQTRAHLAGLLWGDRGEEQARNSLRQTLFEIRRALGTSGEACLTVDHEHVALEGSRVV